jgi:hypothetical protein
MSDTHGFDPFPEPSDANTLAARAHLELARLREENERLRRGNDRLLAEQLEARQDLASAVSHGLSMVDLCRRELERSRRLEEELAVLRVAALPPGAFHVGPGAEAAPEPFREDRPPGGPLDDRD